MTDTPGNSGSTRADKGQASAEAPSPQHRKLRDIMLQAFELGRRSAHPRRKVYGRVLRWKTGGWWFYPDPRFHEWVEAHRAQQALDLPAEET